MRNKYVMRSFMTAAIILILSSFYTLPYYVSKPGLAKELEPIVQVDNGYKEAGSFMLTTVRMGKANIYSYAIAKLNPYHELYQIDEIRRENESEEEYNVRQLHLMSSSKQSAIETAYKKAKIPIHYKYHGIFVLNVKPDMPADGKLKAGDRIFKVDGNEFESSDQFINYIAGKNEGDVVEFTLERHKKISETKIALQILQETGKPGVGISLVDDKEIEVKPNVTINSEDIGGPSAGFMFSLEIYNQLVKEDLTRGYQIAGTGTINSNGIIGRIGGIEQKIVAADKAGADIFLAPNENGEEDSNYKAAVKTAKDIGSKMKIIPVDTFDEAIDYLYKLKSK
ncbi:SepM family pheromone-processing serine protease [Bacillus sp. DTU_2020_1000418_1_SI_GHA_SEK_038]|uniref:SepM family pheromone-processing serine protease n=1 Tax=Bacillus sp. DTU_2020_1000418_1_SI_GHA_SEK_038 TaxID=3077585 RepID=UPI0028EC5E0B|nr:SepM family pheromone-processing serine protease [Bacillus sp. DTU_2020_1000418_1_SI_GHA_SEK_038]WNS77063.1 SepM family pheromone-processing serine protease [Bacillus sp. DTU_2020_1000418_1_SI_GHA_SEK_038]